MNFVGSSSQHRKILAELFVAAVKAADPAGKLERHLPTLPPPGRTLVLGAGKAAASMAAALEQWSTALSGLVVTRYGHGRPTRCIEVVEAAHPIPDRAGLDAALRILAEARFALAEDLIICLLSGGGSSLLSLPLQGLSLEDQQRATRELLACGADIAEINCVRKHMSAIAGGRLAIAAYPAKVITLAISDVVGDDLATIASGPTVPDPTTLAQAVDILHRYKVGQACNLGARLLRLNNETPKPGDARFRGHEHHVIARGADALDAAGEIARGYGYEVINLGDAINQDARVAAEQQAEQALVLAAAQSGRRTCILSGGETTVEVKGSGRGGRNTEFLLSLAAALGSAPDVSAIACDTDGIDGTQDNAGAIITPDTLSRARDLGLNIAAIQRENDAYGLFAALGDLVVTGPTCTNVNDFRAVLVG